MDNNNSELAFTGERLMTEIYEYWTIEHLHRYAIALSLVENKVVIDIASGEGYGSNLLANKAASVTGIDISKEAIAHAQQKYKKDNLAYLHGSATQIPLEDHSIDVVVSFETIEHLDQHEEMMTEIKRVLKKDGVLIISSPDKKYYSDIPGYQNPYHVKELYSDEFNSLVSKYFNNVIPLNQKTIVGSVVFQANINKPGITEFSGNYTGIDSKEALDSPVYNICIASDETLNKVIENSIFANADMFEKYSNFKKDNEALLHENNLLRKQLNSPAYRFIRLLKSPGKLFKRK